MSTPTIRMSTSQAPATQSQPVPKWRLHHKIFGVIVGIALAVIVYSVMPDSVSEALAAKAPEGSPFTAHALKLTAACAVLMGTWWVTEAIPLAVTALVPLVVFPMAGVAEFKSVAAPFASGTIFLFMGGFFLALAIQRWNLHRRIALVIVNAVGASPKTLVLGLMVATGLLTMFVSNTATAVMMVPIGISILSLVYEGAPKSEMLRSNFGKSLVLGIAYSSSITSVSTLIGTPPNALLKAWLTDQGITINFGQWMLFGVPLGWSFLFIGWWLLTSVIFKPEITQIPGGRELIKDQLREMGRMSRGEKMVGVIFLLGATSWILLPNLPFTKDFFSDELVSMIIALALFLTPVYPCEGIPVLDWKTAKGIPWDILLLFGGGLSLSAMFTASGFSEWIGLNTSFVAGLPKILLVAVAAGILLLLTEFTSNTATAAAFLPIMGGIALGAGMNVLWLVVPIALAASYAFMMPAGTPPNAVAFSSGYVQMKDMIKAGVVLNIAGLVMITLFTMTLARLVFGF